MNDENVINSDDELEYAINCQTGKVPWSELEKHFAQGVLIKVDSGADLVDIAKSVINDEGSKIETLMKAGVIGRASSEDAQYWLDNQKEFWAVVTVPWVLVQEVPADDVAEKSIH